MIANTMATVAAGLRQHLLGTHATERHSRDAIERAYKLLASPESELVHAINSHERLAKACGMAQYCLRSENGDIVSKEDIARTLKEIKAALAAAQPAPNHAPE